jgi:hypothetical protein
MLSNAYILCGAMNVISLLAATQLNSSMPAKQPIIKHRIEINECFNPVFLRENNIVKIKGTASIARYNLSLKLAMIEKMHIKIYLTVLDDELRKKQIKISAFKNGPL